MINSASYLIPELRNLLQAREDVRPVDAESDEGTLVCDWSYDARVYRIQFRLEDTNLMTVIAEYLPSVDIAPERLAAWFGYSRLFSPLVVPDNDKTYLCASLPIIGIHLSELSVLLARLFDDLTLWFAEASPEDAQPVT